MTPNTEQGVTRPIIGIENRTAQEVFDIMCDRFRHAHRLASTAALEAEVERHQEQALTFKRYWTQERERGEKLQNENLRLSAEIASLKQRLEIAEAGLRWFEAEAISTLCAIKATAETEWDDKASEHFSTLIKALLSAPQRQNIRAFLQHQEKQNG